MSFLFTTSWEDWGRQKLIKWLLPFLRWLRKINHHRMKNTWRCVCLKVWEPRKMSGLDIIFSVDDYEETNRGRKNAKRRWGIPGNLGLLELLYTRYSLNDCTKWWVVSFLCHSQDSKWITMRVSDSWVFPLRVWDTSIRNVCKNACDRNAYVRECEPWESHKITKRYQLKKLTGCVYYLFEAMTKMRWYQQHLTGMIVNRLSSLLSQYE